jgi:hypothetical protein
MASRLPTRVRRERFLPFAFVRHGLRLAVSEVALDGKPLPVEEHDAIHLDDESWRELRLAGAIELGDEALSSLPPDERAKAHEVSALWLVLRCDRTSLRLGVHAGPASAGTHDFELTVARSQLDGPLEVVPWLVRTRTGSPTPGYAATEGARLASGSRLYVYPHEPAPRAGDFLEVVYVRFSEDAVLRHQPWRLYQLETHGDTPILRINADHEAIVRVLDARGQTGLDARLRETFYDQISRGVWSLLFTSAVETLDGEGQTNRPWQRGVIRELLPHLFPETPKRSRMHELVALREDESHLSLLAEKCDQALQRRLDVVKHMSRLIETTVGQR